MTNREKFLEIFGFTPSKDVCIIPEEIRCPDSDCDKCKYNNYWYREYTGRLDDETAD